MYAILYLNIVNEEFYFTLCIYKIKHRNYTLEIKLSINSETNLHQNCMVV